MAAYTDGDSHGIVGRGQSDDRLCGMVRRPSAANRKQGKLGPHVSYPLAAVGPVTRRWGIPVRTRAALVAAFRSPLGQTAAMSLLACLLDVAWIAASHTSPQWDQAHYLDLTFHYLQAVTGPGGPFALLRSLYQLDPGGAPLFPLLSVPFYWMAHEGLSGPLLLNLVELPLLLFATGSIAVHLGGERARTVAVAAVATMPLLVGLLHEQLQDYTLLVAVTVSVALLLKSRCFQRTGPSLALGAVAGAGILVKVTFPVFLVGPLAVVLAASVLGVAFQAGSAAGNVPSRRTLVLNGGGAAALATIIGAAWYLPQWAPTVAYVRSATSGALAVGTGPRNPATWTNVGRFTVGLIDGDLSWGFALALVAGVLLAATALVHQSVRSHGARNRLFACFFLLAWIGVPYVTIALGHNQDVRLMAPAFPGIGVAIGVAVANVYSALVRRVLVLGILAYGLIQTAVLTWPVSLPIGSGAFSIGTAVGALTVNLTGEPIGYEARPARVDYGAQVIAGVHFACSRTVAREQACIVGVLESDAVVNANTLQYFADVRGYHFQFLTISASAGHTARLLRVLSTLDVALYMAPPPVSVVGQRVAILDAGYADAFMTRAAFGLFGGPSLRIAVGRGLSVDILSK